MNIEEKQEVSGTKNHLLFLMSQFESKEHFQKHLKDSLVMEVLNLRERFVAQTVKNLPVMRETQVRSLGH